MGEQRAECWVSDCLGAQLTAPAQRRQVWLAHQLRDLHNACWTRNRGCSGCWRCRRSCTKQFISGSGARSCGPKDMRAGRRQWNAAWMNCSISGCVAHSPDKLQNRKVFDTLVNLMGPPILPFVTPQNP